MGLQQQRSCVRPDGVPALEDTRLDTTSQQRAILQERSANWPRDFNNQGTSSLKWPRSPSPLDNVYRRRPAPTGSYFTGNVHAHHVGLAGFSAERSEKQIDADLKRLYCMLQHSDKYQKYREKQPVMTVAEVLAKEAKELAEKLARERAAKEAGVPPPKENKDLTVWPEFLEQAFWRALVRWPPMGRKKYMLDGALRGRNELIQDSIRRDTGITRCRKQVSSHLQVLKHHLSNVPRVLVYMAGPDDDKKQSRGRESSYAHSLANTRERHHPQRTAAASSHDYNSATAHLWAGSDLLPSSYGRSAGGYGSDTSMSPYAVTDFTMFVSVDEQPVHFFTQIAPQPRQDDLIVTDRNSWHRQFPEFEFLRTQVDDWSTRGRKILVCDASIKVMTEWRPNANLSISFDLHSQRDLEDFKSIQSTTRFFDNGDMAPDPQFDGEDAHDLKEHRTFCEYIPGPQSCLMIKLGSKFWVNRMMKYQNLRHRNEGCVGISLRRLTATQDVYGIKHGKSGEAECLLTILWRFTQTRSSAEVGRMTWRSVSFDNRQPASVEQVWAEDKAHNSVKLEEAWNGSHEDVLSSLNNISEEASQFQVSHPLDFGHQHHAYDLQASHSQHPPQLHLDILASLQPGLEQPHASAAPSASTDYSQHSLSHVPHGHDAVGIYAHDPNDFNFDGGHINISGAFEPDINLSAYDAFAAHSTGLDGLHGLDHDGYSLGLACADGNELVNVGGAHLQDHPDLAYYSTKPNWQHANLISQLESAAENLQYHAYLDHDQTTHGHDSLQTLHTLAGPSPALTQGEVHGLHDAHINVNSGLWNLASPFHDDAEGGASDGVGVACRKDSAVLGHDEHAVGLGLLDLIERDQRARGY